MENNHQTHVTVFLTLPELVLDQGIRKYMIFFAMPTTHL